MQLQSGLIANVKLHFFILPSPWLLQKGPVAGMSTKRSSVCGLILVFSSVVEAKKTEDAVFQKNNLQRQLRDVEHELTQKREEVLTLQKRHGSSHTEIVQLKMEIDHQQEKLDKVKRNHSDNNSASISQNSRNKHNLSRPSYGSWTTGTNFVWSW